MSVVRICRIGGLGFASIVAVCALAAGGGYAGGVAATSGSWTMTSDAGDWVGQGGTYSFSTPTSGIDFGAMDWGEVRAFADTPRGTWVASVSAPGGAPLRVGVYDNAQRSADATHPGLDVWGDGRGCNRTSGSFTVLDVSYGPLGYLQSVHLTFEEHCEGGVPALRGELNLTAPPPPSPLVVRLTVDPTSGYDRSGSSIQLHGTVTCSQPIGNALNGQVSELTNNGTAFAYLDAFTQTCSTTPTRWKIKVSSATDVPFSSGTLQLQLTASSIDYWYTAYHDNNRFIYATDTASTTIQAKPGG